MTTTKAEKACRYRPGLMKLVADRRGVAAIEFAFIVPLLLMLYFLTMEASQAIETSKKIDRIASTTADLLTREESTSTAEIDAVLQIGSAILQPYNRSTPTIVATAIQISHDTPPKVKVAWSRQLVNGTLSAGPLKAGDTTTVPASVLQPGFLIHVDASLDYTPVMAWTAGQKSSLGLTAIFDKIHMDEDIYWTQRIVNSVVCRDC